MPIHASHQPEARHAIRTVSVLLVLLLLIVGWPTSVQTSAQGQGLAHYLPLHMALETLAIVITGFTFSVIWSARREQLPRNTLLLACAFAHHKSVAVAVEWARRALWLIVEIR